MSTAAIETLQFPLIGFKSPLLRAASDEKLIALTRRGRDDAFETLVERYRPRLLGFVQHMLRSREDAEDVLQEVYVAALRAILYSHGLARIGRSSERMARSAAT